MKTIGGLRKLRHRGKAKVAAIFTFTCAAYNLVRLRSLLAEPVSGVRQAGQERALEARLAGSRGAEPARCPLSCDSTRQLRSSQAGLLQQPAR